MKKRVFALIAVLLLAMANTAQAAVLRVPTATPELSFNDTTANAFALCTASTSDRISAKLTLYQVTLTLTRGALLGRIVYLFLANALSKVVRPIDWFLPGASMELLNPQNQRLENARECIRVCRCNL